MASQPPSLPTSSSCSSITASQPGAQYCGVKAPMNTCVNQLIIKPENILKSMHETVSPSRSKQQSQIQQLEVMVVSSSDRGHVVKDPVPLTFKSPSDTAPDTQSLSEILSKEKECLFHGNTDSSDQDLELEPHRSDVLSVRRRSRQFFTLLEEEEEDGDEVKTPTGQNDKPKMKSKLPLHMSTFNLGESLRRLYYPHESKQRKTERKLQNLMKDTNGSDTECSNNVLSTDIKPTSRSTCGYESDPEECVRLYKKVTANPTALRRIQSHPEMCAFEEKEQTSDEVRDYVSLTKSKSLPVTPSISPRLLRKNSLVHETKSNMFEPDPSGPGFSFLSSVAGQLRVHNSKKTHKDQSVLTKVFDSHLVNTSCESKVVVANQDSTLVVCNDNGVSKPVASNTSPSKLLDVSGSSGDGCDKPDSNKKSFVKSFMSWGTTKVPVSNKESNMFSPSSF